MEFSRRAGLLAAAAAVVLSASACGADAASTETATSPAASAAFPVTLGHVYGETTIEEQPQRVATISWVNADVSLALGVVPVGMALDTWGNNENGSTDWKDAKLDELGAAIGGDKAPAQYDETDGVNFEEIAKLSPDVILAAYSGLTQEDYDKLSKIAPVVGPVAANYTTSWQDATTTIGKALGKTAEADAVVEDVDAQVAAVTEANPVLKESSFIAGNLDPATNALSIYAGGDNRPRFLSALGMTEAPVVAENAKEGEFYYTWAAERGNELESDVFFTWLPAGTTNASIQKHALFGQIPAVKNGGLVSITDDQLTLAISASSPLSLPWALDEFTPLLVDAAEAAKN